MQAIVSVVLETFSWQPNKEPLKVSLVHFLLPPQNMRTTLEKNDPPELDDTELLTGESIQHYLTMVGQLQWLVTLGRFDIHAQVTT